jgi:cytochrome P450
MTASTLTPAERLVDADLHATGDPHEIWRWMRAHTPVVWQPPSHLPGFWSLTKYDDIKAAYRDPATFSSAHGVLLRPLEHGHDPGGGLALALTDPPRHKQLRSLMADWFTTRTVRGLEPAMRSVVRRVLDRAVGAGGCDFAVDVAARFSHHVICGIIGVPEDDQDQLFEWTNEAFHAAGSLAAHQQLLEYFVELMYRRMTEPTDDLMSAVVNGTVDDELLTEEEVVVNFENLLGATENGRLAMIGGMLAFLRHPGQWARLRADRDLLPGAIEEVLRWTSSATHSMRTVTRPTVVRGEQLSPGDKVVLWVPSANRDEAIFDDPDTFDVARTPNRHLALGAGEHFCIGSTLARAEMRALFTALLDDVGEIEQHGPVVPARSIAVSGPEHLPIRVQPRKDIAP